MYILYTCINHRLCSSIKILLGKVINSKTLTLIACKLIFGVFGTIRDPFRDYSSYENFCFLFNKFQLNKAFDATVTKIK